MASFSKKEDVNSEILALTLNHRHPPVCAVDTEYHFLCCELSVTTTGAFAYNTRKILQNIWLKVTSNLKKRE